MRFLISTFIAFVLISVPLYAQVVGGSISGSLRRDRCHP
jgi:hypothetical protein